MTTKFASTTGPKTVDKNATAGRSRAYRFEVHVHDDGTVFVNVSRFNGRERQHRYHLTTLGSASAARARRLGFELDTKHDDWDVRIDYASFGFNCAAPELVDLAEGVFVGQWIRVINYATGEKLGRTYVMGLSSLSVEDWERRAKIDADRRAADAGVAATDVAWDWTDVDFAAKLYALADGEDAPLY